MNINNTEFSQWRWVNYVPIMSSLRGFYLIVRNIFQSSKEMTSENHSPLQGRIQLWSQKKIAYISLIPLIGNAILFNHDLTVEKSLIQVLETSNKEAARILKKLPPYYTSKNFVLKIIAENPHILEGSKWTSDRHFMLQAAKTNIKTLAYASSHILNMGFFMELYPWIQKNRSNLSYPQFPAAKNVLEYFPNLTQDKQNILRLVTLQDLEIAKFIGTPLKEDGEFLISLMNALKNQPHTSYAARTGNSYSEKRPENALQVLSSASPLLLDDEEFIKKSVKIHLGSIDFASERVKESLRKDEKWRMNIAQRIESELNYLDTMAQYVQSYGLLDFHEEMLLIVKKQWPILGFLPIRLSMDQDFVINLLRENPRAIECLAKEIVKDQEKVKAYILANIPREKALRLLSL